MFENCVPTRMFENCKKTGPPSPSSKRTSPPVLLQFSNKSGDVRKLQEDWSHQCCFAIFERSKTARRLVPHVRKLQEDWSTSVVAVFEQTRGVRKLQEDWSHQCCCSFSNVRKLQRRMVPPCSTMVHFVRNLQEHRSECSKTARNTGSPCSKNCNNNGPPCSKSARTLVAKCSKTAPGFKYYRLNRVQGLRFSF